MKIWIINHYALAPSQAGGTRHFAIARRLVEWGHEVTLVASSVDYATRTDTRLTPGTMIKREVIDGVSFVWVRTPTYTGNGVGRIANMLVFAARARFRLSHLLPDPPDVVVGSSPHPFAALAAERIARRFGVPFVLEVRDLWPQSLVDLGNFSKRHPLIMSLVAVERHLYRAADRIICLLPGAEGHIRTHGAGDGHVDWVPNGIDFSLLPPHVPANATRRFVLMYAGAHGVANGLYTALDAMTLLRQWGLDDKVVFRLVGDGPEKSRLRERASALSLSNVEFWDPVPKDRIYSVLQQADAFLMLLKDSPVFRWGVSPNKLFDYMATGRPVLFGVNTSINPVNAAGAGLTLPAEDPEALAGAVRRLLVMPLAVRSEMGLRGRAYVEKHHNMQGLAGKFERTLLAAASNARVQPDKTAD